MHQTGLDLPITIVSGTTGEDRMVMAMKAGAHDYILKGNLKGLVPVVEREVREQSFAAHDAQPLAVGVDHKPHSVAGVARA